MKQQIPLNSEEKLKQINSFTGVLEMKETKNDRSQKSFRVSNISNTNIPTHGNTQKLTRWFCSDGVSYVSVSTTH